MANKRDYYEVLGVGKNATDDEIKKAYRKKAKECHPDLHPDDKEAVERFKELNEANEVLSDPQKRARYDQYGFEDPMAGMGGGGNPFAGGFDFGMGDIFDQLFNGGMGRSSRNQGPVQGNDLRYELRITFEEAAKGCEKSFEIFRNELCATCKGSGAKPGTSPVTCTTERRLDDDGQDMPHLRRKRQDDQGKVLFLRRNRTGQEKENRDCKGSRRH